MTGRGQMIIYELLGANAGERKVFRLGDGGGNEHTKADRHTDKKKGNKTNIIKLDVKFC